MRRGENRRECAKHSPRVGTLISTAGKVSEAPPLSVSRAINQEPKTSWVAASPVHPRRRATRTYTACTRVSTCPQSTRFIYHRFDVSTPFGYRSRKTYPEFLPHSVPMRPPSPPPPPPSAPISQSETQVALSRDKSTNTRKIKVNAFENLCRSPFAVPLTQNYRFGRA